jgi:bifunctional UDP-N-acetylglucosamine pyrophosphorylase/glucosamine-1-phosphate N-acetyltransferase
MRRRVGLVLAAGEGTRFKSDLAKVLHPLCGEPMLVHLLRVVEEIDLDRTIVVVGYQGDQVRAACEGHPVEFVEQEEQLGTGHAVLVARSALAPIEGNLLILYGDVPLLRARTLLRLLDAHEKAGAAAAVLTAVVDDPEGYGRVVRGREGEVLGIVEDRDASDEVRLTKEINSGIYVFHSPGLFAVLDKISPENRQGEYYLTDAIALLAERGERIVGVRVDDSFEVSGINTRDQLAHAEKILRSRLRASGTVR